MGRVGVLGALIGAVVCSAGGCLLSFDYGNTRFRCDMQACPDGQFCVNGFCESNPASDAGAPDAPGSDANLNPLRFTGNVIHATFDGDYASLAHNRSGVRLDGSGAASDVGKYGVGRFFDGIDDQVQFADHSSFFVGNNMTLEAWVNPQMIGLRQIVAGDLDLLETPTVEYLLELTTANGVAFSSNSGCTDSIKRITGADGTIVANVWTHIAASWDGASVALFVNGQLVDTLPFAHTPCESPGPRLYRVGRGADLAFPFLGLIDDVKLSDYAKIAPEIRDSMNFDSTALQGTCGDFIVEQSEGCETDSACCNVETCAIESDGTPCGSGDMCASGVCQIGGGRVANGIVVLYEFDEGLGTAVGDTSGFGAPLNLTIADELNVTWGVGTLTVDTSTVISSITPATKVTAALQTTNEITVEAWVAPANETQTGPSRIVTVSPDSAVRAFTLGQSTDSYVLRLNSTVTSSNGDPVIASAQSDVVANQLDHVVATRDANGVRTFYVNGVVRGRSVTLGDFTSWDAANPLVLANEAPPVDRTWLGTFHLIAVYSRALSDLEVAQNFVAGPN